METKRILCFGDSNTWGATPGTGVRIGETKRWTGVCQQLLGSSYRILEEGLPGRTTVYDDPCDPIMNGSKALGYALNAQKPLDLVVLFLGTNDVKFTNAIGAAYGIDALLRQIYGANVIYNGVFRTEPRVLLMAPPRILPEIDQITPDSRFKGTATQSLEFSRLYRQAARNHGAAFLDAAEYVSPSPIDCLHLDEAAHQTLGAAMVQKIQAIFADEI